MVKSNRMNYQLQSVGRTCRRHGHGLPQHHVSRSDSTFRGVSCCTLCDIVDVPDAATVVDTSMQPEAGTCSTVTCAWPWFAIATTCSTVVTASQRNLIIMEKQWRAFGLRFEQRIDDEQRWLHAQPRDRHSDGSAGERRHEPSRRMRDLQFGYLSQIVLFRVRVWVHLVVWMRQSVSLYRFYHAVVFVPQSMPLMQACANTILDGTCKTRSVWRHHITGNDSGISPEGRVACTRVHAQLATLFKVLLLRHGLARGHAGPGRMRP